MRTFYVGVTYRIGADNVLRHMSQNYDPLSAVMGYAYKQPRAGPIKHGLKYGPAQPDTVNNSLRMCMVA